MTGARVAFAIGLFVVPVILLWLGRGLRKRSARVRSAFWGSVTGYFVGVLVICIVTVIPPIHWDGVWWRDVAVHWSMVLGALIGFAAGAVFAQGDTSSAQSGSRPGALIW